MDITPEMVDAGAEALVQAQTNGLCRLGRVCEDCDCHMAFNPEDPHRDGYARQQARAVIQAALAVEHRIVNLRQIEYPGGKNGMWVAECHCHYITRASGSAADALLSITQHLDAKTGDYHGPSAK